MIIGECQHADANGHFCFVNKKKCAAQGDVAAVYHLILNKWVNYDLCNCKESADCNKNILKFGDDYWKLRQIKTFQVLLTTYIAV